MNESARVARLEPPRSPVDIVLDTDTYNEIDDQFALAYAILSDQQLNLQAICAAPFHNNRSGGPADGMERSFEEIHRVLDRLGRSHPTVLRGAAAWLTDAGPDAAGDATHDLIARAMARPADQPLYVVAIGAPTNVAAALVIEPNLVDRLVVVWLGGQPLDGGDALEFNLRQDPAASRTLFDSGVPLVQVPCRHVAESLKLTRAELHACVAGRSSIGDYLCDIFTEYVPDKPGASKTIWDLAPVAWLIDASMIRSRLTSSPMLTRFDDQPCYVRNHGRHLIRECAHVDRDRVFQDLFVKLDQCPEQPT